MLKDTGAMAERFSGQCGAAISAPRTKPFRRGAAECFEDMQASLFTMQDALTSLAELTPPSGPLAGLFSVLEIVLRDVVSQVEDLGAALKEGTSSALRPEDKAPVGYIIDRMRTDLATLRDALISLDELAHRRSRDGGVKGLFSVLEIALRDVVSDLEALAMATKVEPRPDPSDGGQDGR